MAKKIVIVGAGIIGCSTAYHLSTLFSTSQCQITLISDRFSPYTTSDKSSGCIIPFDVTDPPCSDSVEGTGDIRRWARETIDHVEGLYHSPEVAQIGVTHAYGCEALAGHEGPDEEEPWWTYLTHGFRRVTSKEEKKAFNIPDEYDNVVFFGMYFIDCRVYLPWLMKNFKKNGGIMEQQKVSDLNQLSSKYDIVINCTGLEASTLVPDKDVFPVSGEAISVSAPWLKNFVVLVNLKANELMYVYPRSSEVLLGGSAKVKDYNSESDVKLSESRLEACKKFVPGLENARVLGSWVGLRPCRSKIRLTSDKMPDSGAIIVHCYGHGSKGISLHWGSALEVGRLVLKIVT